MTESLMIHGGPILTMSDDMPVVDAIAIHHGTVVAAGSESYVRAMLPSNTESIHLDGRLATPGLFDAHAHTFMTGFSLLEVDVTATSVSSIADIRQRVTERADQTAPGDWIIGQGYDQASLTEQRHPSRTDLDDAAPNHPVALWRSCHHIMAVNSAALRAAGIDRTTPDPDGGTIDRDELEKALKKLGFYHLSGAQLDAIMKRADEDDNCVIDYDEFVKEAPKTLKTNWVKLAKNNGAELGFLS